MEENNDGDEGRWGEGLPSDRKNEREEYSHSPFLPKSSKTLWGDTDYNYPPITPAFRAQGGNKHMFLTGMAPFPTEQIDGGVDPGMWDRSGPPQPYFCTEGGAEAVRRAWMSVCVISEKQSFAASTAWCMCRSTFLAGAEEKKKKCATKKRAELATAGQHVNAWHARMRTRRSGMAFRHSNRGCRDANLSTDECLPSFQVQKSSYICETITSKTV